MKKLYTTQYGSFIPKTIIGNRPDHNPVIQHIFFCRVDVDG